MTTSSHGMFLLEITKWVDERSPVVIIYLDFQKPFDKVPRQRLILKLKSRGLGISIINWIDQWLNDRRQIKGSSGWRVFQIGNPF